MKHAADYLQRRGYRLPTEAEWEYACRSGAQTSRYYGTSDHLLAKYAWFLDNSDFRAGPVGMKKPNDFGLFDMLGDAWEWCDGVFELYADLHDSGSNTAVRDDVKRRAARRLVQQSSRAGAICLPFRDRADEPQSERRLPSGSDLPRAHECTTYAIAPCRERPPWRSKCSRQDGTLRRAFPTGTAPCSTC